MAIFEIGRGPGGPRTDYSMFAFESITVSSTSTRLTGSTFAPAGTSPAAYAFITIETDGISFRCDGTAATATNHDAATTDQIVIYGAGNIENFRMIRTGGDATLRVSYGR